MAKRREQKIATLDKLAELIIDSIEDLRKDMMRGFDSLADRIAALEDRTTAVESKVAGVHRRIDEELDKRKQHAVRPTKIERHLGFPIEADA